MLKKEGELITEAVNKYTENNNFPVYNLFKLEKDRAGQMKIVHRQKESGKYSIKNWDDGQYTINQNGNSVAKVKLVVDGDVGNKHIKVEKFESLLEAKKLTDYKISEEIGITYFKDLELHTIELKKFDNSKSPTSDELLARVVGCFLNSSRIIRI